MQLAPAASSLRSPLLDGDFDTHGGCVGDARSRTPRPPPTVTRSPGGDTALARVAGRFSLARVSRTLALPQNATSCSTDDERQVLDGHCWMGLGGCWHVTNSDISQADLDALADEFQALDCVGPVCACMPPPQNVGCVDDVCQEI